MRKNHLLSKLGISLGLFLAITSFVTAAACYFVLSLIESRDREIDISRVIDHTSELLGSQIGNEIERISKMAQNVGRLQIDEMNRPQEVSGGAIVGTASVTNSATNTNIANVPESVPVQSQLWVKSLELENDILDVSLWKESRPGTAFELNPLLERLTLSLNSKYSDQAEQSHRWVTENEEWEKSSFRSALQGQLMVLKPKNQPGSNHLVSIATLLEYQGNKLVVVAHTNLDHFKKYFIKNSKFNTILVDDVGTVLLSSSDQLLADWTGSGQSSLFPMARSSKISKGLSNFSTPSGKKYLSNYKKIHFGSLILFTLVSDADAFSTFHLIKENGLYLMGVGFLFFFGLGYVLFAYRKYFHLGRSRAILQEQSNLGRGSLRQPPLSQDPQKRTVTLLYGELSGVSDLVSGDSPEECVEVMNDYFSSAGSTISEYQGFFQKFNDRSFIGIWGISDEAESAVWMALRCALELRKNLSKMNESKKLQSHKILSYAMGVHSGAGILGRMGSIEQLNYSITGDVVDVARLLSEYAPQKALDLLVSSTCWEYTDAKFSGEWLGNAKQGMEESALSLYSVSGYRDEKGDLISVPYDSETNPIGIYLPFLLRFELENENPKPQKWLVNNGSQIVGPLSAEEVAAQLFSQELDFDSMCWLEGVAQGVKIKDAGVFSGTENLKVGYWMFDGVSIHGPVGRGFIKTAVIHGVLHQKAFICEGSTLKGWIPWESWEKIQQEQDENGGAPDSSLNSGAASWQDGALEASLSPPHRIEVIPSSIQTLEPPEDLDSLKKAA